MILYAFNFGIIKSKFIFVYMKKQSTVTICGETLNCPVHVCAFFDSREEQYEVLVPWLKEGIDHKEEVFTILSGSLHNDHCSRLAHSGIPVQEAINNKQLKVVASEDTYLQEDNFAAQRMFSLVEKAIIDAENGPYSRFRGCGDMEWALQNLPGTDELIEYEARLNFLTPNHDCSIICSYDINSFSGRTIADVLATHPYVIMNGKIHKNPHFVHPVEYLSKLIKRPKRALSN
jgi:MEDS: MEthanogen/methylotroph, DcmR Sensory domain